MYGRGNNNVGNSGERTGFSAEPPVDSVPRARSDIVDYRLRNNNNSTGVAGDYSNSDNQGLSQQAYYHPDQQYQQTGEYYDEDEEMEAEKDLAEDAQWKRIQQNTFTRWANEHLKIIDKNINSLETDLSDGLRLIALIEILSQKRMPKYNKRPTFRSQKLENVSVALKFLEVEGIKIVNIDE